MKGVGGILLVAVIVGAIASFVTSKRPDALEHFLESTAVEGVNSGSENPDTAEVNKLELEASPLQPILSGVIGTVVTFVLLFLVSRLLLRYDRGSSEECIT